jgi:hypothetical protein
MNNTEQQQKSAKNKTAANVPVAGDLNASTECMKKSVGASSKKEV